MRAFYINKTRQRYQERRDAPLIKKHKNKEQREATNELRSRSKVASKPDKSLIDAGKNKPTPPQEEWPQQCGRCQAFGLRWAGRAGCTRQRSPSCQVLQPNGAPGRNKKGRKLIGQRVNKKQGHHHQARGSQRSMSQKDDEKRNRGS